MPQTVGLGRYNALMPNYIISLLLTSLWACVAAGSTIELQSPRQFEVVQRDANNQGHVAIRGRCMPPAESFEFRVDGSDWKKARTQKSGSFLGMIDLPAGDWHAFEVRVTGESEMVRVDHVGVGEVFVIAGQSNSTNYGSERQMPKSGMVSTFDGTSWRIADDPQPGVQDHSTGGSFIPAFGDALAKDLHMPIGIASVGCGATSVREWLPRGSVMKKQPTTGKHVITFGDDLAWASDGTLYSGLIERLEQLQPNGCRAILWHQGESDAGQARAGYPVDRQITGQEYHDWLKQIIEQSQKDMGRKIPWFLAQATYHSEQDPADEEFRAAQKQLWTEGIAHEGPDTDQLRAEYRHGVHFNARGLTRHGQLWADKVEAYLNQ
jgi:hypothetical protein